MNCTICKRALLQFETDTCLCTACTDWIERGAAICPKHSPRQQYWIARVHAVQHDPRKRADTLSRARRDLAAARTVPPPRLAA